MAINTANWSHYLTIPESYIPSSATSGQTLVITESVIAKLSEGDQTTFWSNVENGGGDIRICTDDGGVNQLPVEVVSLDSVAETCVIWTLKSTYDGTGNLYVFIGNSGATQPAVTDPFGRNAVWADFEVVYHLTGGSKLIDSSGNHDLTEIGTLTEVAGIIGGAIDSQDNYANRGEITGYSGVTGNGARTVTLWSNFTSGSNTGLVNWGDDGDGDRFSFRLNNGRVRTEVQGSFVQAVDATPNTGFVRFSSIYDGTTFPSGLRHRVNGSTQTNYTSGSNIGALTTSGANNVLLNAFNNFVSVQTGGDVLDEFAIRAFDIGDSQESTEYANQSDPASFYGTPAITAISTPTVTADVDFSILAPVFSASASATLPQPQASVDFTIAPPTFNAAAEVKLPQPSASVDFTIAAPVFSAFATATLPIIRQKPKLTIRASSRSGSTIRAKGSTSRIRVK